MLLTIFALLLVNPDTVQINTSVYQTALNDIERLYPDHASRVAEIREAFRKKDYDEAQTFLNQLLAGADSKESLLLHIVKTRIFYEKHLVTEAIDQYKSLVKQLDQYPELHGYKISIEAIVANLLVENKQYAESARFLKQWLARYSEQLRPGQLASYIHNLGLCYLHLQKFDSAELYLKRGFELEQAAHDTLGLAVSYMDMANLYYEQYKDNLAIPLFIKGLEYAKLSKDLEVLRNAHLNMSVVEENQKHYTLALEHRKEYETIQKKLWDRDKVWQLAEQEKKFEVSLKENEIALLTERERTRSLQRNYSIVAAFLLLFIAAGSTWSYRKVRQSNRQILMQKQRLQEINHTKNRLFSIVAHDLKTPVLALQKAGAKLTHALNADDIQGVKKIAAENEKITDSTYKLLNNVLQWALDQSDQIIMHPESTLASRLVSQVIYDYEGPLTAKGIVLKNDTRPQDIVYADMNSVKIILRNLLDNAIRFSPEGAQIHISSAALQHQVQIIVEDHGPGIDPGVLDNLFTVSGDKIAKDADGKSGTGLGLVLCKSMAGRNHGDLQVENTGTGTRVIVSLPIPAQS